MEKTAQQKLQEALTTFSTQVDDIITQEIERLTLQEATINRRIKEAAIAEEEKQAFLEERKKLDEEKALIEKEKQIDRERKAILTRKEQQVEETQQKLRTLMSQLS